MLLAAYADPPISDTTVRPNNAHPSTTIASAAATIANAFGTTLRRTSSFASFGSTTTAIAYGSQYAIFVTTAPTAYSPAWCAGRLCLASTRSRFTSRTNASNACTACRTSLMCPAPRRPGIGLPQISQPVNAAADAPIAAPANAPTGVRTISSPASVPPTRPTASAAISRAIRLNRSVPCRIP
jgi:hypothetical protein